MTPLHMTFLLATALLLGAGSGLLGWAATVEEDSQLWAQMLAAGSAFSIAAAVVGCVGTIVIRLSRPRD